MNQSNIEGASSPTVAPQQGHKDIAARAGSDETRICYELPVLPSSAPAYETALPSLSTAAAASAASVPVSVSEQNL